MSGNAREVLRCEYAGVVSGDTADELVVVGTKVPIFFPWCRMDTGEFLPAPSITEKKSLTSCGAVVISASVLRMLSPSFPSKANHLNALCLQNKEHCF